MESVEEGVGESCSPPRGFGGGGYDVKVDIYRKLVESGHEEAANYDFWEQLETHFNRLPPSYGLDVNVDRAEDVLVHQKILAEARDPEKCPVFHVRFIKYIQTRADGYDETQQFLRVVSTSSGCDDTEYEEEVPSNFRDLGVDFEACSKLEGLNLDMRTTAKYVEEGRYLVEGPSVRSEVLHVPVHEIIFSAVDKPKLLSQLSALLSDIGLNIREAHVFSTTDGYSLDVFVVDGWPVENTDGLQKEIKGAILRNEGSWSGSSHSSLTEKILAVQPNVGEWEIDKRLLKVGEMIACGTCGDLYHGTYLGQDVAIKILRTEHLNDASGVEFAQEVIILREVQHENVVRFIGACTRPPQFCIITEYMPGGNLYDFLHKYHNVLELSSLLKVAIDVSKGMDYLHKNNIIHRDLKTANLLMDTNHVVKVADFGVARFQSQGENMTAETGTYRWMAPEVISHQPYDHKADVFSFAIVLWELVTSKVPYDTMTPVQAALGVRQGLRPELPENTHPRLLNLMQRCWEAAPGERPSFSEITLELEELLQEVQRASGETSKRRKEHVLETPEQMTVSKLV